MAAVQVRLSQITIDKYRQIGKKELGDSATDDKIVWTLCLEHERMKTEIELLTVKLKECENKKKEIK